MRKAIRLLEKDLLLKTVFSELEHYILSDFKRARNRIRGSERVKVRFVFFYGGHEEILCNSFLAF